MKNVNIKTLATVHQGDQADFNTGFVFFEWFSTYTLVRDIAEALESIDIYDESTAKDNPEQNLNYYTIDQIFDLAKDIHAEAVAAGKNGITVVFN